MFRRQEGHISDTHVYHMYDTYIYVYLLSHITDIVIVLVIMVTFLCKCLLNLQNEEGFDYSLVFSIFNQLTQPTNQCLYLEEQ